MHDYTEIKGMLSSQQIDKFQSGNQEKNQFYTIEMDSRSELIRKKYLYRRLIMSKKLNLPLESAKGMVGPDCAYHLYSQFNTGAGEPNSKEENTKEAGKP